MSTAAPTPPNAFDLLTQIGFRKVGQWSLRDGVLDLRIDAEADARNVLYAFVIDGEPLYVGKTTQPLKKRMQGYKRPGPTQSTNIRNHGNLVEALRAGYQAELYVLPDHGLLHFGVFHLNLAAGLEDSIVRTLQPTWNRTGT